MSTLLLAETAEALAITRCCLAATRSRIALGRRLLNVAWGISGASDGHLRLSIRDRLERGALALAWRSLAFRWGEGQVCVVCEQRIATTDIANRSLGDDGQPVWAHVVCLQLWREETLAYELVQIERERQVRPQLCAMVRDGFADGSIPVLPYQRSRSGRGMSGPCSVCRKPVSRRDMVNEVVGKDFERPAFAHPICYRSWWLESLARRRSDRRSGRG